MTPERQVLYALVAAGFHLVVLVLGIAAFDLVPPWWSLTLGITWLAVTGVALADWRRTARLLLMSIGLFVIWAVGTLAVL